MRIRKITTMLLAVALGVTMMPGPAFAGDGGKTLPKTPKSFATDTLAAEDLLSEGEHEEDELLVTFQEGTSKKKIGKVIDSQEATCEDILTVDGDKTARITIDGSGEEALQKTMQALAEDPRVAEVQPNYRYKLAGKVTQDPFLDKKQETARYQYHLETVHAEKAWELLEKAGHERTIVGVVDGGLDPRHQDLQANRQKTKEGGEGYVWVHHGKPQKSMDDPSGLEGHGTHVTGIIGATYGNGKGGSGVAAGHNNDLVRVLTVCASEDGMSLTTYDIVTAIRYAVSKGARVINMSFGAVARDRVEEKAIREAFYEKGVVFTAASGNEGVDSPSIPADMREVIAVNASDAENSTSSYWSDYGWEKDITAPGNNILSTLPGDRYGVMSGTSMAAPVAAAVAGLVLDARPDLTPDQVRNILCGTTRQNGTFKPETTAYGIVDAEKAVQAAMDASKDVPVDSVALKLPAGKAIQMETGEDRGLNALCLPATSLAPMTWHSSDEAVVTVDDYGNLLATGEGEATVTVTAGGKSDSCKVVVRQGVAATGLTIQGMPEDGQMEVGEWLALTADFQPEEPSISDLSWYSDNEKAVIAHGDGFLEAVAPGTATVRVEAAGGKVSASCKVQVKAMATRLQFTKTLPWLFVGEKGVFAGRLLDIDGKADVAHKAIVWSSTNRKVASVEKKTGKIRGLRAGKFFVKAENFDGSAVATRQVIVAKRNYAGKADYNLRQTGKKKKSLTISWNRIPVAAGYQIQKKVKTGKKSWKWKNVRSVKGTVSSAKFKGKGKKQFRVRAYYKKNGKTGFFGWSNELKAKTGKGKKAKKAKAAGKSKKAGKTKKAKKSKKAKKASARATAWNVRNIRVGKQVIRGVDDDLTVMKQKVQEFLDMTYDKVGKRETYSPEVWAEINRAYRETSVRIRNARKTSDLIEDVFMGFAILTDDIADGAIRIDRLSGMNVQVYRGKSDLRALQKDLQIELKKARSEYSREEFNDFYWDVWQDKLDHVAEQVNAITSAAAAKRLTSAGTPVKANTLDAYLQAMVAVETLEDFEIEDISGEEEEQEEEEEEVDPVYEDEDDDLDPQLNWYFRPIPEGEIYTKSTVAEIRKMYERSLREYVKTGLPAYGYKGKASAFDSIIKACVKDMAARQDVVSIYNRAEQAFHAIDKKSGINFGAFQEATYASKIRMRDRMKDWFTMHYRQQDYSKKGWSKLTMILMESRAKVRDCFLEKQVTEKLFTEYKARMAKVETKKQEHFRITTRKKGKGKITASASVKWGQTFTVRMKAKKGHRIKFLKVDGKKIKKVAGKKSYAYTFTKVSSAHTVYVKFK